MESIRGEYLLPTTHQYAVGDASSYKKGNTAYVLVRTQFAPSDDAYADGGTYDALAKDDFYVGANGKFYTSAANSQDPTKGGVVGQKVTKYENGKVLYYAWVNPDEVASGQWYNSPAIRNNIYHIHITGFRNLGTNWNPLYPENPDRTLVDPSQPYDPIINPWKDDKVNPDPKPVPDMVPDPANPGDEIPTEEPDNPIKPEDPLTNPETWMSVDITILPWTVHSYSVDLGI